MRKTRFGLGRPCGLLLLAGLGLAGCAPPPPATPCEMAAALNAQAAAELAPVPGAPQPLASVGRRGVRMTDAALAGMALVDDVQTGRRPNGSAEVAVRLLNCTAVPLQVEGATSFMVGGGAQAEAPTVWKRIFLPPGSSRVYEELSTGRRPDYVSVDLRGGS